MYSNSKIVVRVGMNRKNNPIVREYAFDTVCLAHIKAVSMMDYGQDVAIHINVENENGEVLKKLAFKNLGKKNFRNCK